MKGATVGVWRAKIEALPDAPVSFYNIPIVTTARQCETCGDGPGIGEVSHTFGTVYYGRLPAAARAEMITNARLFAAAKEMFIALSKIEDEDGRHFELDANCRDLLRHAMAKAKGEPYPYHLLAREMAERTKKGGAS